MNLGTYGIGSRPKQGQTRDVPAVNEVLAREADSNTAVVKTVWKKVNNAMIATDAAIEGSKLGWHRGTTPPTSPSDGDLWLYTGQSGLDWLFVYDSSETTYKWKFIGGPAATASITTDETANVGAWGNATTAGPDVVVARAGIYNCNVYCLVYEAGGAWISGFTGPAIGNSTPVDYGAAMSITSGQQFFNNIPAAGQLTAAAGDTIRQRYYAGGATYHFMLRRLTVMPVKII